MVLNSFLTLRRRLSSHKGWKPLSSSRVCKSSEGLSLLTMISFLKMCLQKFPASAVCFYSDSYKCGNVFPQGTEFSLVVDVFYMTHVGSGPLRGADGTSLWELKFQKVALFLFLSRMKMPRRGRHAVLHLTTRKSFQKHIFGVLAFYTLAPYYWKIFYQVIGYEVYL